MYLIKNKFLWQLLALLIFGQYSSGRKYQFLLDNEDIFSQCSNQPSNVLGIKGLFNFSEMTFNMISDIVWVTGNATIIWNIEPNDRIQGRVDSYHYERGAWMQTLYNLAIVNVCQILYDETQLWFSFWGQHIINLANVKDKCFNVPGTKLIHEPFDLNMSYDINGVPLNGRYKIVVSLKAFDQQNKERKTSICFEIIGEVNRLS